MNQSAPSPEAPPPAPSGLIAEVRRSREPEGLVLVLAGSLDHETSYAFYGEALRYFEKSLGRGRGLILDLSRVGYASSSGIGTLARLLTEAELRGLKLFLAAPTPRVRAVLELLGMITFFDILSSWEPA